MAIVAWIIPSTCDGEASKNTNL